MLSQGVLRNREQGVTMDSTPKAAVCGFWTLTLWDNNTKEENSLTCLLYAQNLTPMGRNESASPLQG